MSASADIQTFLLPALLAVQSILFSAFSHIANIYYQYVSRGAAITKVIRVLSYFHVVVLIFSLIVGLYSVFELYQSATLPCWVAILLACMLIYVPVMSAVMVYGMYMDQH